MTDLVYIADWQIQCCGEEFAVGDEINWPVAAAAPEHWVAMLGTALASAVVGVYDAHEDPGVVPQVAGTVRGIRTVSCRFAPSPPPADPRELCVVPGTGVLEPVDAIDKWYDLGPDGDLRFCGWLVELDVRR